MGGMRLLALLVVLAAGATAAFGVSAVRADNQTLTGTVGPGFNISLQGPSGTVKNLDPGTYTLVVHDQSDIHNFHLFGPGGVDVSTDIGLLQTQTFTVTLVAGKYTFICDAHPTSMKGTFTVGGAAPVTTTTAKPVVKPKPKKKKH